MSLAHWGVLPPGSTIGTKVTKKAVYKPGKGVRKQGVVLTPEIVQRVYADKGKKSADDVAFENNLSPTSVYRIWNKQVHKKLLKDL